MNRYEEIGEAVIGCRLCGEDLSSGEIIVETDEGPACEGCSQLFGIEEQR